MDKLETVPLDSISIPKNHIRVQSIDEKAIKKLADSINSSGLLVRIILRPVGSGGNRRAQGQTLTIDRWADGPLSMKSEEKSLFNFFFFFCPALCKISTSKKIHCVVGGTGRLENYRKRRK